MKLFNGKQEENPWISISDLMSVLMMVFLFVSITYMVKITIEKKRIETIAVTYENLQNELYLDLKKEFGKNLKDWNAILDESTLSIRFEQPDILFEVGSAELKNNFKALLDDFFPRYLNILTSDKYKNDIEEIRIEGHTSSEWFSKTSEQQAYFNNMELSQNRTRKVLEYILRQDWNKNLFEWEKKTSHSQRSFVQQAHFRCRRARKQRKIKTSGIPGEDRCRKTNRKNIETG